MTLPTFKKNSGLSLIEVMVVVSIISILSAMSVPRMLENAKRKVAEVELGKILSQIERIRMTDDKTLMELTNNGCSSCTCRSSITNTCKNRAKAAFKAFEYPDGWKSKIYKTPFMIDENEGESHWANLGQNCILDSIVICDLNNQQAYVTFIPGYKCIGQTQFDASDDEGEAFEDIASLFRCES